MNTVVVIIVVFAVGVICGHQFSRVTDKPVAASLSSLPNNSAIEAPSTSELPSAATVIPAINNEPDEIIKQLSFQTPKTQFERYRAFQQLDLLSVAELERLLLAIDDSQLELKRQVAWFFSGKFPEPAFDFMESSMGDNQMPLAQLVYEGLTSSHPEKIFDWLQNNENDFVMLYPVAEQQFERKMALFQALSILPDWKWAAYEAGLKLIKESVRPHNKWSSQPLAQAVAQANPMEAINYALAQHHGAVDKALLNGALVALSNTNPVEAKRLALENQAHLDTFAINSVVRNLVARGELNEVFSLTNTLADKSMLEFVIAGAASDMHLHGSEKVSEYIASISDPALKVKAVNAAASSMLVAGYPVEKLLEITDMGLRDLPVSEKVISYTWIIKRGYEGNPQAMAAYLNQMKTYNKELAIKVEELLGSIKGS